MNSKEYAKRIVEEGIAIMLDAGSFAIEGRRTTAEDLNEAFNAVGLASREWD